jgi:hypothetical protein
METLVERLRRILQRAQHPRLWLLGPESSFQVLVYACLMTGLTGAAGALRFQFHRVANTPRFGSGSQARMLQLDRAEDPGAPARQVPSECYGTSRIPGRHVFLL